MDLLEAYMRKHHSHMIQVFKQMSKQDKLEATKNSFDLQQFRFELNGKDFFSEEDNYPSMEKLLESYYRMKQNDNSKKFYLYRIQFSFEEIGDILQYWLEKQPNLKVVYIEDTLIGEVIKGTIKVNHHQANQNESKQNKQFTNNLSEIQNNQFDIDEEKISQILLNYQQSIKNYEQKLKTAQTQQEKKQIISKIQELNLKIKVLQQRAKASSLNRPKVEEKQTPIKRQLIREQTSKTTDTNKSTTRKAVINYKAIFQFYAKQTHLTGVKATFDRIEHQSQTINYQKLVHFLREFNLFPENVSERKKVHNLYIKHCMNTRDLNFDGFMSVIEGVASLLQKNKSKQQLFEFVKQKILEKNTKNGKLLNHPFHSLERQDFRINVNELNYSFKMKPQEGKFVDQVNQSLEKRRKDKQQAKSERSHEKKQKNLRYLKKLQSIDPFNPLVLKNSKMLQQKPKTYQPIASLQNIEQYRDNSFNFQNYFGLDLSNEQPISMHEKSKKNSVPKQHEGEGYKRGDQTQRKVEKIEKDEVSRMKSLMSGIIQRTNAKMQKLGISLTKQQMQIKYN